MITSKTKYNYLIKLLAFLKVPLLFSASPSVVALSDDESVVFLPFKRKNKNHVGSMYFGALAMGAELSIALTAIKEIEESSQKIEFIFKDFHVDFLKRPKAGVYFESKDPQGVKELVHKAKASKDRLEKKIWGFAYIDLKTKEPVIEYALTLSVKNREK